jgi:nucleotide-binding universal stress UspA family protein
VTPNSRAATAGTFSRVAATRGWAPVHLVEIPHLPQHRAQARKTSHVRAMMIHPARRRFTTMSERRDARIVVGIDGSPSSTGALSWAMRQAHLTGAGLEAVTAWEYPVPFGYVASYGEDFNPDAQARLVLDRAIEEAVVGSPAIEIRRVVAEANPARMLVGASKDASLLVVGSRGHGELAGLLLGSVSQYCVGHADCPVVVIRGPGAHLPPS